MAEAPQSLGDRSTEPLDSGEALYLYCLARRDSLPAVGGPGVDEESPLTISAFQDVAAVVSAVKLEDFCGPVAEARMKELAWLGPRACRHEEVIERAMRSSPVVPARFATLFSSPGSLEEWLETHHEAISLALDRFAGHEEWAVKGELDRRKAEAPLLASALARQASSLAASPGARYLIEKRIRAGIGRELDAWLREVCQTILAELVDRTAEFRERPIVSGASEEGAARVLNWAFLVPREALDDFGARVDRINAEQAERGLTLDLTGPWPPYSFCPALEPEPME